MKKIFLILCTYSFLYGASPEEEEMSLDLKYPPQLGVIDSNGIIQHPIFAEEIQIPKPILLMRHKSPGLAVTMSLIPGLGHVYLGDLKTAGALIGSASTGYGMMYSKKTGEFGFRTFAYTCMYSLYAAYRDARNFNGQSNYLYEMPTDSFLDLTLAPFKWSILKKPEVWGGVLGCLALGIATVILFDDEQNPANNSHSSWNKLSPFRAFAIGVGEEALFRGYLQSQLSEIFTPLGGIAFSCLIFGATHALNGLGMELEERRNYLTFSIPFITVSSAYEGWLTYKNHSLKESVAVHAWYDFILMGIGKLAGQAVSTGCSRFAIAFAF